MKPYYRVCRDEFTLRTFATLEEAVKFLTACTFPRYTTGYLDEITDKGVRTLFIKELPKGDLIKCD